MRACLRSALLISALAVAPLGAENVPSRYVVSDRPDGALKGSAAISGAADLFTEVRSAAKAVTNGDGAFADTREIRMNPDALSKSAAELRIDGRFANITWISSDFRSLDNHALFGIVAQGGAEIGEVILTAYKGGYWGQITLDGQSYVIETKGMATFLHRFDSSELPDALLAGGDDVVFHAPGVSSSVPHVQATRIPFSKADTLSYIDVLMAYSPDRRDFDGGVREVEGQLQAQVDLANAAEEASGTTTRYRIAGYKLFDLPPGTGVAVAMEAWVSSVVRIQWQRQGQADMMSLAVDMYEGNSAGLAFSDHLAPGSAINTHAHPRFAASGMYIFAHEAGHNRGADHDVAAAAGPPGLKNHGNFWRAPSGAYRDPMAYPHACHLIYQVLSCPTVSLYGSPKLYFEGVPTGIVGVSELAEWMRETGPIVARHFVRESFSKLAARWFPKTADAKSRFTVLGTLTGEFGSASSTYIDVYRGRIGPSGLCQGQPFAKKVPVGSNGKWSVVSEGWKAAPAAVCLVTSQGWVVQQMVRTL